MKPSTLFYGAMGLLSPIATSAIELNPDDPGEFFTSRAGWR